MPPSNFPSAGGENRACQLFTWHGALLFIYLCTPSNSPASWRGEQGKPIFTWHSTLPSLLGEGAGVEVH